MKQLIEIIIDGNTIQANPESNILNIARNLGIYIPSLCYHPAIKSNGHCQVCLIEIEGKDGFFPACRLKPYEGLKVNTFSTRLIQARRLSLELLLSNHPHDCITCSGADDCQLRKLAKELGLTSQRFPIQDKFLSDNSTPAISINPNKCILCGLCVSLCEELGVNALSMINNGKERHIAPTFQNTLIESTCVMCGRCIDICPTAAIREQNVIEEVLRELQSPWHTVLLVLSPLSILNLSKELNLEPANILAIFKALGFAYIFNPALALGVTLKILREEIQRKVIKGKDTLITSHCPATINFIEHFYPNLLSNISQAKSIIQTMSTILKTNYAKTIPKAPGDIYTVSISPCVAQKFEANREEMKERGINLTDAVLTLREAIQLIQLSGLASKTLEPIQYDEPFNTLGNWISYELSGGLTSILLKEYAYKQPLELEPLTEQIINIDGTEINTIVVNGLEHFHSILSEIDNNNNEYPQIIELMACQGGCIGGAGCVQTLSKGMLSQTFITLMKQLPSNLSVLDKHPSLLPDTQEEFQRLFSTGYIPRIKK